MRYVTLGLWAEGPSDHAFLQPLLRRLVVEHVLSGQESVEVTEAFIRLPDPEPTASRADRIEAAVSKRPGEISLLFIHSDGKGSPSGARTHTVSPAMTKIESLQPPVQCVAVVPVHETEAWVLADREALAQAMGVNLAHLTSLPSIDMVESHQDPKQCLNHVRASVRRGNRRVPALDMRQVGEAARFAQLRFLESFRRLDKDLRATLQTMHLL